MYPELFRIGNFPIHTYGVFLALAFLSAILITVKLAARDGLPREKIYDLCLWMLLSSLVGSKILMLLTEPEYRDHPLQLLSLDFLRSGGVFYGGLIGAILTGYFLMRRYNLPWWKTADACAPGIAIGNFFGRQGCFAAGCCWGKPTTLPWGVRFTELGHEITGVPTDAIIRIVRNAPRLLLFAVASQAQALQRAGDPFLRVALFGDSLLY
jgi:phosphatidylglycerol:prolipoprotein diacylglycerol transferase